MYSKVAVGLTAALAVGTQAALQAYPGSYTNGSVTPALTSSVSSSSSVPVAALSPSLSSSQFISLSSGTAALPSVSQTIGTGGFPSISVPIGTGVLPVSSLPVGTGSLPSSAPIASSASTPNSPITASAALSSGVMPSYLANSTVESVTTEIVYTTVTTCPVTSTPTSGPMSGSAVVTTTTSTVFLTSTITICTKCVPPPTGAPNGHGQGVVAALSSSDVPPYPISGAASQTNPNGPIVAATTLSYTLGTGTAASVVTTVISNTIYQTNTQTVYATPTGSENSGDENSAEGASEGAAGASSAGGNGPLTSTIHLTSTLTVYAGAAATSEGQCPAQVTVTVTGPEETVTITAMGQAATTAGSVIVPQSVPAGGLPVGPVGASNSVAPYPVINSNGTMPTSSEVAGASTGFITKTSVGFPDPSAGVQRMYRH